MALHPLLALISQEGVEPRWDYLSRWTETPSAGWEPEPVYGRFVDDAGRVNSGKDEVVVSLSSDDPRYLAVDPVLEAGLPDGASVVFLDWGRQPLGWEEIFGLWEAWDAQDMVVGCGTVGVPWGLADRWLAPGWVAFRDGFDGAPLTTIPRKDPQAVPDAVTAAEPEAPTSFLARARQLRGDPASTQASLPMLPFTLESLNDPGHPWPVGVA
jgi:hypothetical protein